MKETVTWEADWMKAQVEFYDRFQRDHPGVPLREYGVQVAGRPDGSDFGEMARLLGLIIGNARYECGSSNVFVDLDAYEHDDDGEIKAVVYLLFPHGTDTTSWTSTGFNDDSHSQDRAWMWDAARDEVASLLARGGFRKGGARDMKIVMVEFEPGEIAA